MSPVHFEPSTYTAHDGSARVLRVGAVWAGEVWEGKGWRRVADGCFSAHRAMWRVIEWLGLEEAYHEHYEDDGPSYDELPF